MTGAEHYAHAEELLEIASDVEPSDEDAAEREQYLIGKANVHATLALAAATHKVGVFAHGMDDAGYGR